MKKFLSGGMSSITYLTQLSLIAKLDVLSAPNHAAFVHMAFNQKLEVLSCLVNGKSRGEFDPLVIRHKAIVPMLRAANTKRNVIVHSVWRTTDGKVAYQSLKARGEVELLPVTIRFIKDANQQMEVLRQAMFQLL